MRGDFVDKSEKWDNAAVYFQQVFAGGQNEYNKKLLMFLEEKNMLHPGDKVIDVGCGVGKYGQYFALRGCDVTLTDISAKMLGFAEKNMARFDTPWRTIQCDFAEIDAEKLADRGKYALAISTFCPAVCDTATVRKFSEITDGFCFVSRFCEWEQPERDALFNAMGITPKSPHSDGNEDCENIIRCVSEAGYAPQLEYVDYCWSDERTVDGMTAYICDRYYEPGELSEEFRLRLKAATEKLADNGIFKDSVNTKVMWLYWKT